MEDIKISLQEVTTCANELRNCGNQIYEHLQIIKKEINDLNASWISESGETLRGRFNAFASRFEKQKEIINSYGSFLDFTVSSYDSLETTINSNASNF
ncbi:pore-forming ESAT-6 family protein [Anaerorhabdus sp.]|jgi:uncharacterized protein YukE|uniref:pore-forming ESAT-6 family protein n=1 Tax=Anaerorhabdus sp. TaxID=1872524 RepID=UPI002FC6A990